MKFSPGALRHASTPIADGQWRRSGGDWCRWWVMTNFVVKEKRRESMGKRESAKNASHSNCVKAECRRWRRTDAAVFFVVDIYELLMIWWFLGHIRCVCESISRISDMQLYKSLSGQAYYSHYGAGSSAAAAAYSNHAMQTTLQHGVQPPVFANINLINLKSVFNIYS